MPERLPIDLTAIRERKETVTRLEAAYMQRDFLTRRLLETNQRIGLLEKSIGLSEQSECAGCSMCRFNSRPKVDEDKFLLPEQYTDGIGAHNLTPELTAYFPPGTWSHLVPKPDSWGNLPPTQDKKDLW